MSIRAGTVGFEPTTNRLEVGYSVQTELRAHKRPPGLCIVKRHRGCGTYLKFGPLMPVEINRLGLEFHCPLGQVYLAHTE